MGKITMFGNKGGKISNKGFERFGGPCVKSLWCNLDIISKKLNQIGNMRPSSY